MKKFALLALLSFTNNLSAQIAVDTLPQVERTAIETPSPESLKALIDSDIFKNWEATNFEPSLAGGAHRSHVKTYTNSILTESILAGNKQHPIGSIAIKALYSSANQNSLTGYAISVKNRDDNTVNGANYYWMEGFLPNIATSTRQLNLFGNGNRTCTGCHTQANFGANRGGDFVIIRPLIAQ